MKDKTGKTKKSPVRRRVKKSSAVVLKKTRASSRVTIPPPDVYYRSLFENAQDGILILDAETGMIVDVNPFLIKLLGYSHELFLGKTIWDIGFLKDVIANKDGFRELQEKKYMRYEDLPLETADGRIIEVEFISNVYEIHRKKIIQCNIRDITGRKQSEELLNASEIRYRRLFEAAQDGILILDAETGMIVDVNPFLIKLLGYSHELFLGKTIWDIGFLKDVIANKDGFRELQEKKYMRYEDLPLETADGRIIEVEFISNVYEIHRKKIIQCNIRDITDRKLAEEELAAAYRELEAFSYSVSHDLRAPLRAIDGFSQAVLEDYGGLLDGQGKDYLNRLRAASQQMGRLIDDILNLSRITRSEMRLMPVDLSAIARDIAAELKAASPGRDATFIIADAVSVNGDPALMRIVMENLINNAWKFTGSHPRAMIEFGTTDIAGVPTFFVRDDGAGFDMQYVGKLFGAFQRLHSKTEFEGTGIGLTLAKRIILRHHGRIWAEGAIEKGATIYFTI